MILSLIIVASDYENVLKLEAFEREFDFEAAESLENDIYFLPTANLIFNEYLDECSDFTFNTIGHIISYPDTDKFDNYKEWIKHILKFVLIALVILVVTFLIIGWVI